MKKISVFIFLFVITMFGCSPVAPSLSPTLAPENIFTPIPTSTIEPIPTVVPTQTPFPHVSKITTLATFNAITAITSSNNVTDVWAVGNDGLIVAYQPSHDHPSFSHVESPKRVDQQDVDFVTPDDGWIVGGGDMILYWNGETWEISKPSTIDPWAQFYTYSFYNIAFSEANDGWAASCVNSEGGGQILIYHWDGVGWSEKASLESANIIYARKPDDIFAIGDKLWHWDGSAWTEIDLTTDIYPVDPNIIDFIDVPGGRSSELWLLDSSGIIYTVNLYWLDFGN